MKGIILKYKSRKYFQRIVISTNLLIISFLMISSLTLYFYSEQIVLKLQRESNEKVLSQMNFNINYMNEIVKNFAFSIFFDSDFIPLMESDNKDTKEYLRRITKLKKLIDPNTYIESLLIYNHKTDKFYTVGSGNVPGPDDVLLNEYLTGERPMKKLQFTPLNLDFDDAGIGSKPELFSMFLYNGIESYTKSESLLMMNIKPEWLFQNIKVINGLAASRNSHIYILDQNKQILTSEQQTAVSLQPLKETVYREVDIAHKKAGQFTYKANGDKQIVNYMVNPANNWIIVSVQPYEDVLGVIDKLMKACIIVIIVCFLLGLGVSLFVGHRLYNPIERLLNQFKRQSGSEVESVKGNDELDYMSEVYHQVIEKMKTAETKLDTNQNILKSYYLRKLITDSRSFTAEDVTECSEKGYFQISENGKLMLAVLKMDRCRNLQDNVTEQQKNLYQFAVSNISAEIISGELPCEIAAIRGEHLVVFIDAGNSADDVYDRLSVLIRQAQDTVLKYYKVTFTAAFSDLISDYQEITYHYGKTLNYSMYRLFLGQNTVITPDKVRDNMSNPELHLPEELERKLIEAIRMNHPDTIVEYLHKIREKVAAMSYESALQSIIRLGMIIHQSLRELNQNKLSPVWIDMPQLNHSLLEKETLEEVFVEFSTLLRGISTEQKHADEHKNEVLIETVKDFIHANYSDNNLSLQGISGILKMSSAYIGRIFKKHSGLSVAEYISEVRMREAVALLENNELPIYEIVSLVGLENQHYFFKLFKQRFGTTPKEYRIKKSLE